MYYKVYRIWRSKIYDNGTVVGFLSGMEVVEYYLKVDCDKLKRYTLNPQ